MSLIGNIRSKKIPIGSNIFLYAIFFTIARTGIFSNIVNISVLFFAILIVLFSSKEDAFLCLLFSVFIADNITLVGNISFESVIDLMVLFKFFNFKLDYKAFLFLILLTVTQLTSILVWNNLIINVISFVVRVLLVYYISIEEFSIETKRLMPFICIMSISIGCIIGLVFYPVYSWQRFQGIWNDENFCGMYCLVAILLSLVLMTRKDNRKIILPVLCMGICFYTATQTWSRSFIFIFSFIIAIFLLSFIRQKNVNISMKFVVLVLGLIVFVIVINYSFNIIIANRGLTSNEGTDWTNGRLELSKHAVKVFIKDLKAFLLGSGINNVPNMVAKYGYEASATHNTFVDFFVQFGIISGINIYVFLGSIIHKGIKLDLEKDYRFWMLIAILSYGICLTLTQYTIFYVSIGLFCSRIYEKADIDSQLLQYGGITYE